MQAKFLVVLLGLSMAFGTTVGMQKRQLIQMPNQEVLSDLFEEYNCEDFAEETGVINDLASEELSIEDINKFFSLALDKLKVFHHERKALSDKFDDIIKRLCLRKVIIN